MRPISMLDDFLKETFAIRDIVEELQALAEDHFDTDPDRLCSFQLLLIRTLHRVLLRALYIAKGIAL